MHKQIATTLAFGVVLLSAAPTASAKELSYAYMEVSAAINADVIVERSNIDSKGDGYGIAFSWLMGPVAYSEWKFDDFDYDDDVEGRKATARFGAHHRFRGFRYGKLDVYGGLSVDYVDIEAKNLATSELVDDTGIGAYLGLQHSPNHHIEYGIEAAISNIEEIGRSGAAHVQWNVTHAVGLRLSYQEDRYNVRGPDVELNTLRLAARITFGTP